jgi:hypothetical protein
VDKCRYRDLEHGISVVVAIYVQKLVALAAARGFTVRSASGVCVFVCVLCMCACVSWGHFATRAQILVHPVVPVLDVTRPVVLAFNKQLHAAVVAQPTLRWLNGILDKLLVDGKVPAQRVHACTHAHTPPTQFNSLHELDGTHVHANYLAHVAAAIERVLPR